MAGRPCRTVIVVGASAGGLEALEQIVRDLPTSLPAALCIVLHIGDRRSAAPSILGKAGPLPASHAIDGEVVRPGHIYVAPPGFHMLIGDGGRLHLSLSRGPRENGTRPAADPLFRSAANAFGGRVIGVVLSGALSDGTAGLSEIKRLGGVSVVQDPADARYPGMPRSALHNVPVDHCLPAAVIGGRLARLVSAMKRDQPPPAVAKEERMEGDYRLNVPETLTCPECGGSLKESQVDSLPYFSCHIGHRFGADSMEETQFRALEQTFEVTLRTLNERAALCRRLADSARGKGRVLSAGRWDEAAREATERAEIVMRFLRGDWVRPDPGGEEANGRAP